MSAKKRGRKRQCLLSIEKDLLARWWKLGSARGLISDTQIAAFLLQQYENVHNGSDPIPRCSQCHRPLTLLCAQCNFPKSHDFSTLPKLTTTDMGSVHSGSVHAYCTPSTIQTDFPQGNVGTCSPQSSVRSISHLDKSGTSPVEPHMLCIKLEPVTSREVGLEPVTGREMGLEPVTDCTITSQSWGRERQFSLHKVSKATENVTDRIFGAALLCENKQSDSLLNDSLSTKVGESENLQTCDAKLRLHAAKMRIICVNKDFDIRAVRSDVAVVSRYEFNDHITQTDVQTTQVLGTDFTCSQTLQTQAVDSGGISTESDPTWPAVVTMKKKKGRPRSRPDGAKRRRKQGPCICKECGVAYNQSANLKLHIMREHTGERPFVCEICGKSYLRVVDLTRHTRQRHTGERPFACDQCDAAFAVKSTLMAHMRIHSNDKHHICHICGAAFTYKGSLNVHMRVHTRDKPFSCTECGQAFSQHYNLLIHMRKHTGEKPHNCQHCGASFRQAGTLKTHLLLHSGERPFKCIDCGHAYTTPGALKVHRRTHTGDRPYVCKHCGAGFSNNASMKRHTRKHTGERPYLCKICGFAFVRSHHLKTHMQRKHTLAVANCEPTVDVLPELPC